VSMKTRNSLAFGASYSLNYVNAQFAAFVASLIPSSVSKVVGLTRFDIPLFTPQQEEEIGILEAVKAFDQLIQEADILVIFSPDPFRFTPDSDCLMAKMD
jgi:NAD(P)H-dependent FMN reductase